MCFMNSLAVYRILSLCSSTIVIPLNWWIIVSNWTN